MVDFMAQLFPYTYIALMAAIAIFLATEGRVSTIMLYVAVIVQGTVVVTSYAFIIATPDFSAVVAIFYYLIPSVPMFYFVLCAVVFNDIVGGLKGKLKLLMTTSLISYGLITCMAYLNRQIYNWIKRNFTFWDYDWTYAILFWSLAALWILSTLIAHGGMLIYALKTTPKRTKKIWAVIAFLFPIVGSAIYLFVRFVQVLLRAIRR